MDQGELACGPDSIVVNRLKTRALVWLQIAIVLEYMDGGSLGDVLQKVYYMLPALGQESTTQEELPVLCFHPKMQRLTAHRADVVGGCSSRACIGSHCSTTTARTSSPSQEESHGIATIPRLQWPSTASRHLHTDSAGSTA